MQVTPFIISSHLHKTTKNSAEESNPIPSFFMGSVSDLGEFYLL